MTQVTIDLRKIADGGYDGVDGSVKIALLRREPRTGYILVQSSFVLPLSDGIAVVDLPPSSSDNAYSIKEQVLNGIERIVQIPNVGEIGYEELLDVDPASLIPSVSALAAWDATLSAVNAAAQGAANSATAAGTLKQEVEVLRDGMVVNGYRLGDNLILTTVDGYEIDAGNYRGTKGDKGDKGDVGEIGPAGLTWRGLWDAETDYVDNDAVFYEAASWFAAGDPVLGEEPTAESEHWFPMALQGSQGRVGDKGDPGIVTDIVVAEVTTLSAGSPATVNMVGEPPVKQLYFGVPRGPQGYMGDLGEAFVLGNVSGALQLSAYPLGSGVRFTANGNITIASYPTVPAGKQGSFSITMKQDSTGSRTITWPAGIKASSGIKPPVTTGPGLVDMFHLFYDGVDWWVTAGILAGA